MNGCIVPTMDPSNDGDDEPSDALFSDAIEVDSKGENYEDDDDDDNVGDGDNLKTVSSSSSSSSSYNDDDEIANDILPYPIRVDFPDVFVSSSSSTLSSSLLNPRHTRQYPQQSEKSKEDINPYCDRRLSRAARSLLMEKLQKEIFSPSPKNGRSFGDTSGRDEEDEDGNDFVWSLVERWMAERLDTRRSSTTTSGSVSSVDDDACPLYQSDQRDVYYQEESSMAIVSPEEAYPGGKKYAMKAAFPIISTSASPSSLSSSKGSLSTSTSWYKCGICGKVFSTRFYLDFHWETSDRCRRLRRSLNSTDKNQQEGDPLDQLNSSSSSSSSSASSSLTPICPATDWCPLVGGISVCHERALRDEPFYDRGVSGSSSMQNGRTVDDAGLMLVRHKWSKIFHSIPCSVETIRNDCRSILTSCGLLDYTSGEKLGDENFCDMLSCPTQQGAWQYLQDETEGLYHWYQSGFKSRESHDYHHEEMWKNQASHHTGLLSSVGVAVLLGLVGWIYSRTKHEYVLSLPMRNSRFGRPTPDSRGPSTGTSRKRLSVNHRWGTTRTFKSGTTARTTRNQSKSSRLNPTSRRPTSHFHED